MCVLCCVGPGRAAAVFFPPSSQPNPGVDLVIDVWADKGTLTLGGAHAGLTFHAGDGTDDTGIRFSGMKKKKKKKRRR